MISLDSIKSSLHSVEIQNAAGQALTIDGSGFITANINGTVSVSATDLDVRDLTSASDSVEVKTAAGQALAIDGAGAITISNTSFSVTDGGGSLTVDAVDLDIRSLSSGTDSVTAVATDFDIRDLAFATDSVTAHQGGTWSFQLDNMSSWQTSAASATSTASELAATPLTGRSKVIIQNLGNADVYIGPTSGVTTANGVLLPKGSSFDYPFDETANIFAITGGGTSDIRVLEAAA